MWWNPRRRSILAINQSPGSLSIPAMEATEGSRSFVQRVVDLATRVERDTRLTPWNFHPRRDDVKMATTNRQRIAR